MSLNPVALDEFETLLYGTGFSPLISPQNLKVAVAVSGGADSLALTLLLSQWVQKKGGEFVALTVDHGLRTSSAQEAQGLHDLLTSQGIQHHILTWYGDKPRSSLQEKARAKRYELLKTWCLERGYGFLFLGHHQGDQSETYCMRLRQKSGLLGLACMQPLVKQQCITIVRPFLTLPKTRLQETLKALNREWIEDPSNQNVDFERVFWRHVLKDSFLDLTLFQGVRKAYEGWIKRYLTHHGDLFDSGYVRLKKKSFDALPQDFQGILLSFLLQAYGVGRYPLSSRSLWGILEKMKSPRFSATTAQGIKISKHKDHFLIIREYRAIQDERPLLGQPFIWDKRFLIRPQHTLKGVIKCVGEKGWLHLLKDNPDLKKIDIPRAVLWSLPSVWSEDGRHIHPTFNGIVEGFQRDNRSFQDRLFIFRSKSPF